MFGGVGGGGEGVELHLEVLKDVAEDVGCSLYLRRFVCIFLAGYCLDVGDLWLEGGEDEAEVMDITKELRIMGVEMLAREGMVGEEGGEGRMGEVERR